MILWAVFASETTSDTFEFKLERKISWKIALAIETPNVDPVDLKVYWMEVVHAWYFMGTAAINANNVTVKIHEYPKPEGAKRLYWRRMEASAGTVTIKIAPKTVKKPAPTLRR